MNDLESDLSEISDDSDDEYMPTQSSAILSEESTDEENDEKECNVENDRNMPNIEGSTTLKKCDKKLKVLWRKSEPNLLSFSNTDNLPGPPESPSSPLEYFRLFISSDMIELLVQQTNPKSIKYKYPLKSNRWYMYIFWHTISMATTNSWLLYRRHCGQLNIKHISFRNFLNELAYSLVTVGKKKVGRPSLDSPKPPLRKKARLHEPPKVRFIYLLKFKHINFNYI